MEQPTLRDLIEQVPEHKAPHPGNIVSLSYPSVAGGVAVDVDSRPDGSARFSVRATPAEVDRSVRAATRALARATGNDPDASGGLDAARHALGREAFEQELGVLVRRRLLSLAFMRTGIFPFLWPAYHESAPVVEGEGYSFTATVTLRPYSPLSDYEPLELAFPAKPEVDEALVEERVSQALGGRELWEGADDEALAKLDPVRDAVREQLAAEAEGAWYGALMELCSDKLAERLVMPLPARYVEALRDEMASRYATAVEEGGQSWDEYVATPGFDLEAFKEQMTGEARAALRRGLALDALAEHEGIRLTEGDVLEYLGNIAPGHEAEAAQSMVDSGQMPQLMESALRAKTAFHAAERARDVS